jgi:shikimate dehydrogenase
MQPFGIQLGLAGYPLGHSLSPKIHTAALTACGLRGEYSLFSIWPDDIQGLKSLLARVRKNEIHGLNITIPHKQNIIPMLDELTPTSKAIGAVNTIYLRENKLIGDNTDAAGFLADLKQKTSISTSRQRSSALILGAGGSARAVVYALTKGGWNVTLAARRIDQANEVAQIFENIEIIEFNEQTLKSLSPQLIINTTPLGMVPDNNRSPWPEMPFPPQAVIYDLVYNPRETKLVKDARAQGLSAFTGMGMLVEQAALSFEIWTGFSPTRSVLFEAINQYPSHRRDHDTIFDRR